MVRNIFLYDSFYSDYEIIKTDFTQEELESILPQYMSGEYDFNKRFKLIYSTQGCGCSTVSNDLYVANDYINAFCIKDKDKYFVCDYLDD